MSRSANRLGLLARGLRQVRRTPDLAALRAARTPAELSGQAIVPAGRNLGVAIGFLPARLRAEATAALLACRVLDAFEDLVDRPRAHTAVSAAVAFLNGDTDTAPLLPDALAVRDSEAVDRILAERIHDVRALLAALPADGRTRVARMLADVGAVMARNLESPLPRTAYSEGVLGRVVLYACSLVAPDAVADDEAGLGEMARSVGITAQLANDLRDNELELYGAVDRAELTRAVMMRLLAPALGSVGLLVRVGPRTPSAGARAAMAYMAITTAAFLCAAVGAPAPYRRRARVGAALLAAGSARHWTAMLQRVLAAIDGAIHRLLDAAPELAAGGGAAPAALGLADPRTMPSGMAPLIVDTTFALVRGLSEGPLTGELSAAEIRRMMIADHLAFAALERLPPRDPDATRALAEKFLLAAVDPAGRGGRP